jgi:hypothetical protein
MEAGGGILKRRAEMTVVFDHYFSNYTRLLRMDDKVRFKGQLYNDHGYFNIGAKDMSIIGHELHCIECKIARGTITTKAKTSSKFSDLFKTIINDCSVSTKYILNFLLNPVIIFK